MIRLADVVERYRADLIAQYNGQMLPSHYRALDAIEQCRTSAIGTTTWYCDDCDEYKIIPLSCGHRNCPTCQNHETSDWLQRQLGKRVDANYFMVTFTLPWQLRQTVFSNQHTAFSLLFKAAVESLRGFGKSTERLKGQLGMIAVLHTNNRQLDFHPHVHVLLPALAIQKGRKSFQRCGGKYLFNVKALSKVFRAKTLHAFNKAQISLPTGVPQQWNVHCKPVGRGEKTLQYLARYLYRGVISERRILSMDNDNVEFEYLCSDTKTYKRRILPAARFLWQILIHVLPRGFQRARCYGFLHHNCHLILKRIQLLLNMNIPETTSKNTGSTVVCDKCDKSMTLIKLHRVKRKKHRYKANGKSPPR